MNSYDPVDPRVDEFTHALTRRAREAFGGQVTHAQLLAALDRGWPPALLARECSRDLPDTSAAYAVVQRRIAWASRNDPPTKPKPAGRAPQEGGCEHTTDPNGWLMDDAGAITGKCPCWPTPITRSTTT